MRLARLHEAQLREVDYWIATNEKIGRDRLVHEGLPDGEKTKYGRYIRVAILKSIRELIGTLRAIVKPIHDVLNRRSK